MSAAPGDRPRVTGAGQAVTAPRSVSAWQRLNPVTPLLRGWRALAATGLVAGEQGLRERGVGYAGYLALAALPVVVGIAYVAWRRTRWRVEGGDLRIESGVVTRRSRRVPLARLQAVDVVRPLLGRLLGVAELRLEVVGRGRTEATLAYLAEEEAQAVRARLLALAHGLAEHTPAPPEAVLVEVPTGRLVGSLLLSGLSFTLLLLAAYLGSAAALAPAALPGALAAVLPAVVVVGRRLAVEFGFTVAASPDGLRLRHGLLETRAQTVPRGRVQAVRVIEPLAWRPLGWVRVEVDVAGYRRGGRDGSEERAATAALLPVAPRRQAQAVLERVLDGLRLDKLAVARAPRRARLRAPLSWHFLGVAADARWSVTSYGRLRRVTDVVPHGKVQSLRLVQGPVQRRLRLATLHLDTAGRDVHAAARHRDAGEARRLLDDLTLRARAARRERGVLAPRAASDRPAALPPGL